jgi:hypothetical protein
VGNGRTGHNRGESIDAEMQEYMSNLLNAGRLHGLWCCHSTQNTCVHVQAQGTQLLDALLLRFAAVWLQCHRPLTCAAASTKACCSCVLSPPMSRLLCVLLNSALMCLMEVSPDHGAAEPVPKPVPIPCSRQTLSLLDDDHGRCVARPD